MRSLLAALVALSASALALKVSDCTSASGTALTYDLTAKCYTGTFDASGNLDITINVPSTVDGKDVRLIMWNAAQSATFAATVNYRGTDDTTAAVAATNARGTATSTATIPFTYVRTVTAARMGEHHIEVSAGSGVWAFVVDAMGDTAGTTTVGATSNTGYSVLAGAAAPTATVNLRGGFVAERVIVKTVALAVSPASSEASARPVSATLTPDTGSAAIASASVATANDVTTATFNRVTRPGAMTASAELTLGNIATTYYNWASNGPYFTGTAAIASAGVTAYPKVTAAAAAAMTVTAAGRALSDVDVVEVTVDALWWNVTANAPSTNAAGYKVAPPLAYLAVNPSSDAFTTSGAASLRTGASANVAADLTWVNSALRLASPATVTTANAQELVPVTRETMPRVFLRIARSAGQPATGLITSTVAVSTTKLMGSCASYSDCYKEESDHPALRFLLSGDTQAARFRRCLLIPSLDDPTRPSPKCSECVSDCDCGSGQYCHSDPGICTNTAGAYGCDPDSNDRFGVCVPKDPTGQIIGGACRADAGSTFGAGTSNVMTSSSAAIVANGLSSTGETSSLVTGHGFCGGVAYYNASNAGIGNANGFSRAGVARATLWTGSCLDGVCHECATGSATSCSGTTCIQGREVETIVVDNTDRTFTSNVVAGTTLATTLMLVLAIIVVLADCICRHRWREEDIKQRKLNHQRRHAHHHHKQAADAEAAE